MVLIGLQILVKFQDYASLMAWEASDARSEMIAELDSLVGLEFFEVTYDSGDCCLLCGSFSGHRRTRNGVRHWHSADPFAV